MMNGGGGQCSEPTSTSSILACKPSTHTVSLQARCPLTVSAIDGDARTIQPTSLARFSRPPSLSCVCASLPQTRIGASLSGIQLTMLSVHTYVLLWISPSS